MSINESTKPRWKKRLWKELAYRSEFESLNSRDWELLLKTRSVTSRNHDTILSLDWPHYCAHATSACGGTKGWCYTFQGKQAGKFHNRHAAMVDILATREPVLFAKAVYDEVQKEVERGQLLYPNIRVSGSGEIISEHVGALSEIKNLGVWLWGFTRNLKVAVKLQNLGIEIIFSCDRSSPPKIVQKAKQLGLKLGYSSDGVADIPPEETHVTFPIHRVGRVREVVDTPSLCPKVLSEFFDDTRPEGYCQTYCHRCHLKEHA